MKRILQRLFMLLCLAVMVFSGVQIYRELAAYHEGDASYAALETYIVLPPAEQEEESDTKDDALPAEDGAPNPAEPAGTRFPEVDFDALSAINPDIVGWLFCEGTVINYPVVQTTDDEYYLHHLFDGSYHKSGCLFLEADNASDFSDIHNIIYGHHMKNGSMFQSISKYEKQSYYDEHPTLLLMTPEQNYTIRLFAGYVSPSDGTAWQLSFDSDEAFERWLQSACTRSDFDSGITPAVSDAIITLSTCSYEYEDARYVVLGILEAE